MSRMIRLWCMLLAVVTLPAMAQQHSLRTMEEPRPYQRERDLIEASLETVVAVLQETTLSEDAGSLSDRLRDITARLVQATKVMTPADAQDDVTFSPQDLERLRTLLYEIQEDLEILRVELEAEEEYGIAGRLANIERDMGRATRLADQLVEEEGSFADAQSLDEIEHTKRVEGEWVYRNERSRKARRSGDDDDDDWDHGWRNGRWYDGPFRGRHGYRGAFVGEMWGYEWPFRNETALYRPIPALRYNRVEGFVLGVGRMPMGWDDYYRGRVYGQIAYAFALEAWRYEVGLETRLDNSRKDDYGIKVGASYRHNTTTDDLWKTSWTENSLAAFFFENDFFDYYEAEGWTIYAVQRITPFVQFSAGYRSEEHRSLSNNTHWSLFDGGGFSVNPFVSEGQVQTVSFAVEGGHVKDLHDLPRGAAFRFEAEIGDGVGGDFAFNRYIADGRMYLPLSRESSLAMRVRGGVVDGDRIPFQKHFTLGGIGSVRGYDQNMFTGTRMLLGNAEYIIDDLSMFDDLIDDFQVIGFFDAGWTNGIRSDDFDFDDIYSSAGVGLGFANRAVRLELAWPLRDAGDGLSPSLWLRLTPSF